MIQELVWLFWKLSGGLLQYLHQDRVLGLSVEASGFGWRAQQALEHCPNPPSLTDRKPEP